MRPTMIQYGELPARGPVGPHKSVVDSWRPKMRGGGRVWTTTCEKCRAQWPEGGYFAKECGKPRETMTTLLDGMKT